MITNIELEAIKTTVQANNTEAYIRQAFTALGVEVSNIKSVHHSPGGFAPNPRRWCITLYKSAKVSAAQINTQPGLSGAVVNGNQLYVLLGELGKAG